MTEQQVNENNGRICRLCFQWKLADSFGRENRVRTGLKSVCYNCRNKEWRQKHPNNKKYPTDNEAVSAYQELRSCRLAGNLLGVSPGYIRRRLNRAGLKAINRHHSTPEEKEIIKKEYESYRDAGKQMELRRRLGRSQSYIYKKAHQLGLVDSYKSNSWKAKWKYMTEEKARSLFEKFKKSKFGVGVFCRRNKYDPGAFSLTMRQFFPDEWELVVETKFPRGTKYVTGRYFEYRVRDDLRNKSYWVMRSPRSQSPVDLIALKKNSVPLFVQCKKDGKLRTKSWNEFYELCSSIGAVPILAGTPNRTGIFYWKLTGIKNGRRGISEPKIKLEAEAFALAQWGQEWLCHEQK